MMTLPVIDTAKLQIPVLVAFSIAYHQFLILKGALNRPKYEMFAKEHGLTGDKKYAIAIPLPLVLLFTDIIDSRIGYKRSIRLNPYLFDDTGTHTIQMRMSY